MGRTVLLHGQIVLQPRKVAPGPWIWPTYLIDQGETSSARLSLVPGPADPVLAFLRRVPLVGRLAPRAQVLREGNVGTFRVQQHAVPGSTCATCYEALLLDADPSGALPPST
jgi:hypothetical protein